MPDTIAKPNASETAYRTIRASIISGELAEGERLTEQRLSNDLGLSRTPIREAIGRLILEGFVERQAGYTTRVAHFPEDEAAQVFEIRQLLEGYAARRAAERATPDLVAKLRLLCAQMERHTPPKSDAEYEVISTSNQEFHQAIAAAAGSPRLSTLMSVAVDIGMVTRTYHLYSEVDLIRSLRHHIEITDAIEAGAPDWAECVMKAHLLAAAAQFQKAGGR
ncbi:MAG: GntR family transcriptional regulator [Pseudomonadota bacterium]